MATLKVLLLIAAKFGGTCNSWETASKPLSMNQHFRLYLVFFQLLCLIFMAGAKFRNFSILYIYIYIFLYSLNCDLNVFRES